MSPVFIITLKDNKHSHFFTQIDNQVDKVNDLRPKTEDDTKVNSVSNACHSHILGKTQDNTYSIRFRILHNSTATTQIPLTCQHCLVPTFPKGTPHEPLLWHVLPTVFCFPLQGGRQADIVEKAGRKERRQGKVVHPCTNIRIPQPSQTNKHSNKHHFIIFFFKMISLRNC